MKQLLILSIILSFGFSIHAQSDFSFGLNFLQIRNTHNLQVENTFNVSGVNIAISHIDTFTFHPKFGIRYLFEGINHRGFRQLTESKVVVSITSAGLAMLITFKPSDKHEFGLGPGFQFYYASNVEKWRRIYDTADYGVHGYYQLQLNEHIGLGVKAFVGLSDLFEYARIDELGNIGPSKKYFRSSIFTPYISFKL